MDYIGNKKLWLVTSAFLISSISVSKIYYQTSKNDNSFTPTWTANAAEEAEAVAAIYCSGHGRAFFDGRSAKGVHVCECNNCYNGSDCSVLDTKCPADVVTGDATFLEKYWLQNKSRSAVVIPGWHRMSYYFNPYSEPFTSFELEHHIRRLHEVVGNARVDDKYIVFGNGVTQLLTGLVIALSQHRLLLPNVVAKVVAEVPYYPVFRKQTTFFRYKGYQWSGNATDYIHTENPQDFIELVTSPNNPDGNLKVARIRRARAIYDRVYYWPHYTAISHLADEDIMLFSLSKLTGHAGSRLGWALIRNLEVYKNLTLYMVESSEGTSHDTQLRTLGIVKEIVKQFNTPESSNDIFKFGYQTLRRRWKKINELVSYAPSKRFSLQVIRKQDCSYFGIINRDPSPAFGWLKCEWEEDMDCAVVLKDGNILTQGGELFDTSRRYARLSLIKTEDDFDQMMEKLKPLVNAKRISVFMLMHKALNTVLSLSLMCVSPCCPYPWEYCISFLYYE